MDGNSGARAGSHALGFSSVLGVEWSVCVCSLHPEVQPWDMVDIPPLSLAQGLETDCLACFCSRVSGAQKVKSTVNCRSAAQPLCEIVGVSEVLTLSMGLGAGPPVRARYASLEESTACSLALGSASVMLF